MTIDKFGRSLKSTSQKGLQGPKGEGFKLTPEGDFDINNKRLTSLGDPVDNKDAVNLHYFKDGTPKKLEQSYSVHQYRIQDVAYPQLDGDAVNYKCMKDSETRSNQKCEAVGALLTTHSGEITALKTSLSDEIGDTMDYINNRCLVRNTDTFDAKGALITNLKSPLNGNDVATKRYVDSRTPYNIKNKWSFSGKRLSDAGSPEEADDVVTIKYLEENTICKQSNYIVGQFNCKDLVLSNVGKPQAPHDAVNKKYVLDELVELSYAIYKSMPRDRRELVTLSEWKSKIGTTGRSADIRVNWGDLFRLPEEETFIDTEELTILDE